MTRDELDATLDRMARSDAAEDGPGLITINSDHWCGHLSTIRATCASLSDGLRYRDIMVLVSSLYQTGVQSRRETADRGAPYHVLAPCV